MTDENSTEVMAPPTSYPDVRHKWYEDLLAVSFGTLFIGMGVVFYSHAQLITGGISGLSLVLSYMTKYEFGLFFFVLNIPFYALAIWRMGWRFTLKTILAVAIVSLFPDFVPRWLVIQELNPIFAAIFGGTLVAMGMIALFRHGSGIGGISILAHFLQEKGLMRAGWFLLIVDLCILAIGFFAVPLQNLLYSVIGAVVMNVFVAMNHRPGRYFGK